MMTTSSSRLRIGCVHRIRHFPYWATLAQGMNARAAELDVELCLPGDDADEEWVGPVSEVVQQRPHVAILPHSVVEAFPEAVEPFRAAGIPIVGVELPPRDDMACVVRADEAQGATSVVTHLFGLLGGRGKVANIGAGGPTPRQQVFEQLLGSYPAIELVADERGDWHRESGVRAMHAVLERAPDVRGVFAHNDHMAVGACQAIAERGLRGQIAVVGFDADPEGLIAIRDGVLAATIYRGLYGVGRAAVDAAVRVARREQQSAEMRIPTVLITNENLVAATLDTTLMLPGLLHDLIESGRSQRRLQEATIAAQRVLIQELSTPILPIGDSILIMPLIGTFDSARAQQFMETMLAATAERNASHLIIDITGIPVVDTAVAHHIIQASQAARLLGAQVILVGISPDVAQTLVSLAVSFEAIITLGTLQDGLEYAQRRRSQAGPAALS
jgi:ABC-type sugar transport system substrate-binding protein